jgi:hypothetical protein
MEDFRNYIETVNPFKLAAPPAWWLKVLHDQDAELVVFPSQLRMAYVLARRRRFSNAIAELDRLDKDLVRKSAGMDGDILAQHNLIYVRHLIGDTVRRKDHDLKANGGAEKVVAGIEDAEDSIARRKRAAMIDDIDHRARDAWRSYQARTGRRAGAGQSRSAAKQMPVKGFTPAEGSAAIFTGR